MYFLFTVGIVDPNTQKNDLRNRRNIIWIAKIPGLGSPDLNQCHLHCHAFLVKIHQDSLTEGCEGEPSLQ